MELQIFELKPEHADEAIRLARELWEILRRKQGCVMHRLYRSASDKRRFLVYSEWQSLAALGGARKELARSPLYRKLHSMLNSSSERAYEPQGAIRSMLGTSLPAEAATALLRCADAEQTHPQLDSLKDAGGYLTQVVMSEVGENKEIAVVAHFASQTDAEAAVRAVTQHKELKDLGCNSEIFKS